MSKEVLEAQQWLNQTYGSRDGYIAVKETGLPGTATSMALVSALQIELGLSTVTGVFGDQTYSKCDASPLAEGDSGNRVKILQYGLYSKGYNPGSASGIFDSATKTAILAVQEDAGLLSTQLSSIANGRQSKAILGVDEYKLVSTGNSQVRTIQQRLNQLYLSYSGICAADGVYSRSTNKQLIFALQAEEGLPVGVANGNFGPSTKTWCPDLGSSETQYGYGNTPYSTLALSRFENIAAAALYCNGVDRYEGTSSNRYNPYGTIDGGLWNALNNFQADYALPTRRLLGLDEWMALLVSTGNPNRDGTACDCSTKLTRQKASALVFDGYSIVGRYLTGTVGAGANKRDKSLSSDEISVIFDVGLNLFCIFQDDEDWWQDHDDLSDYFSYSRGYKDAAKAVNAAMALSIPQGELIYFAVDYDFMQDEVYEKVVPYFQGIQSYFNEAGNPFLIGIYSARNTCGIISAQGYACSSFISDMSTGYSGNYGFPLPSNWAFDQIFEYSLNADDGSFAVDKNTASGRYEGFSAVSSSTVSTTILQDSCKVPGYQSAYMATTVGCAVLEDHGTNSAGYREYVLSTEAAASYYANSSATANVIKEIRVSVVAHGGASFEPLSCVKGACYPSVDDSSPIESFLERSLVSRAVQLVLKIAGIRSKAVLFGVSQLTNVINGLDSASTSSTTSSSAIERRYRWGTVQAQVNQVLVFPVIFPTPESSLTINYTVISDPNEVEMSIAFNVSNPE